MGDFKKPQGHDMGVCVAIRHRKKSPNLQGSAEITPDLKKDHALQSFVPSFSKWRAVFVPHKSGPGLRY